MTVNHRLTPNRESRKSSRRFHWVAASSLGGLGFVIGVGEDVIHQIAKRPMATHVIAYIR